MPGATASGSFGLRKPCTANRQAVSLAEARTFEFKLATAPCSRWHHGVHWHWQMSGFLLVFLCGAKARLRAGGGGCKDTPCVLMATSAQNRQLQWPRLPRAAAIGAAPVLPGSPYTPAGRGKHTHTHGVNGARGEGGKGLWGWGVPVWGHGPGWCRCGDARAPNPPTFGVLKCEANQPPKYSFAVSTKWFRAVWSTTSRFAIACPTPWPRSVVALALRINPCML
jgi:hypothetical protein